MDYWILGDEDGYWTQYDMLIVGPDLSEWKARGRKSVISQSLRHGVLPQYVGKPPYTASVRINYFRGSD